MTPLVIQRDLKSRLSSNITVTEVNGSSLNNKYTVLTQNIVYDNSSNEISTEKVTTTDYTYNGTTWVAGLVTTQTDSSARVYDQYGRLSSSNIAVTEVGGTMNNSYTVATSNMVYDNNTNLILTEKVVTTENGLVTTQTDSVNRTYDQYGRLASSTIIVNEAGGS